MKLSFNTNTETGDIAVQGTAECGRVFTCALVRDPLSESPTMILSGPLGFSVVRKILEHIEAIGKEN